MGLGSSGPMISSSNGTCSSCKSKVEVRSCVDVNERENSCVKSIISLIFLSGNRMDATPHDCEG